MMTWSMARATAASVPGRSWMLYSAREPSQVTRGSTVMSFIPRFIMSTMAWP